MTATQAVDGKPSVTRLYILLGKQAQMEPLPEGLILPGRLEGDPSREGGRNCYYAGALRGKLGTE